MIPALCFITDAEARLSIPDQAMAAARGGAGWIQLRHKTLNDADFADLARRVMECLAPTGARLIFNDRVEVARALVAPGLHVGQSDGDIAAIRRVVGPDMILGLSIETEDQVASVPPDTVDYLGVGPVRASGSKADHAKPIGFDGLARICALPRKPCLAIGGLGVEDVPAVRASGCAGVAVVSAISRAAAPEDVARNFVNHWSRA